MKITLIKTIKITAWIAVGFVVLAAVAALWLHRWLASSPQAGVQIVAEVEKVSHFKFQYQSVDARLGWLGPEIVFRDANVYAPGADVPLIHARYGRVGFDAWRAIRTLRLTSGRVILEGAEVYVDITEHGVTFRGQGDLGKESHFVISDLPVGHLKIIDAALTVEDHRHNAAPWTVNQVGIDIERDPNALRFGSSVHLPDKITADISIDGEISGDLEQLADVDWYIDTRLRHASLGGWSSLAPSWLHLPKAGNGQWGLKAAGHGYDVSTLNSQLDLKSVVTESGINIHDIAGRIDLSRHGQDIQIQGSGLTVNTDKDHWQRGQVSLTTSINPDGTIKSLKVQSPLLSLSAFRILTELMPDHPVRSWVVGLKPDGLISMLDLTLTTSDSSPLVVQGKAQFEKVSWQAYESAPGVANLSGLIAMHDGSGKLVIKGHDLKMDLAKFLPQPFELKDIDAAADLLADKTSFTILLPNFSVHSLDGDATGKLQLKIPYDTAQPMQVALDASVANVDARHVPNYLPLLKFPAVADQWLTKAFLDGRAVNGRIILNGDLHKFPFREGGGLFRATAELEGLHLHYADTFQDLENAKGSAVFENQGFTATLVSGHIGGLSISHLKGGIEDFKEGHFLLTGDASGDARAVLSYLQTSLVGPSLGSEFMHLSGQGPINAHVTLDFPFRQFADRVVSVDANLKSLKLKAPHWDDEIKDVTGSLQVRNYEVKSNDLSATILGGPARLKVATEANKKGQPGEHQLIIDATGHAVGERAAGILSFSDTKVMSGGFDWTMKLIAPRIESRPKPILEAATNILREQDWQLRWLPITVHLESNLQGLTLNLPKPLNKAQNEKRLLKVDVLVDPKDGVGGLKQNDIPRTQTAIARVGLGSDSALLQWSFADAPHFDRGCVRIGSSNTDQLPAQGLSIDGHVPVLDLSAWLSLPVRGSQGSHMSEILRAGNVDVDRLEFLGFGFPAMHLRLSSDAKSWITEVEGAAASGRITIPFTLPDAGIVDIDMDHLAADGYIDDSKKAADTASVTLDPNAATTNPKFLPAIRIKVKEVMFQRRRFGSLNALVERGADGLTLKDGLLKGNTFDGFASGQWLYRGGQSIVSLNYTIDSHNVEETLSDWGFEPVLSGKSGKLSGDFTWKDGLTDGILLRVTGHSKVNIDQGQLLNVHPGAYKVLGLLSLSALPKRLLLDFRDLTDSGLAFESVRGDFDFQSGNATTNNLLLKGPAAEIAIVGRTGLLNRDYDQTVRFSGKVQTPLAAAGGVLAGPAVGAAVLLFSNVFKGSLGGINATYYHIGGSWDNPKVDHLGSTRPKSTDPTSIPTPEGAH